MEYIDQYIAKNNVKRIIPENPSEKLGIIVVVPCYNEDGLLNTLNSLIKCLPSTFETEVIVIVNNSTSDTDVVKEQNLKTYADVGLWLKNIKTDHIKIYPILLNQLSPKYAGVGLARKIGMDEAVIRFNLINKTNGIIANIDADTICLPNYLNEIDRFFTSNPQCNGASIYFEHPVFINENNVNYGIIYYELHLRYLNQCFRYIGHPHAFQTIGSAFAVTVNAYVKQGGMNTRKAGEDFYFLQKIIQMGIYGEINNTCVFPSGRESDRVPFGTGAAINKWNASEKIEFKTYNFEAFLDLKTLIDRLSDIYNSSADNLELIINQLSTPLKNYLEQINVYNEISRIKLNTNTLVTFKAKFFQWFSIFRLIKYLNFTKDNFYVSADVVLMSRKLLQTNKITIKDNISSVEILELLRGIESGKISRLQ